MAYSRYFGMRSFENVIRDGRFRTPAGEDPIRIGAPVTIDPDVPGYMKLAGDGAAPTQGSGLCVFEHIQNKSDALTTVYDSPYDKAPAGQYAQIMHGPGAKVWFKNHAAKVLYDGRTQEAGTLLDASVNLTTLKPGDGLVPTANGTFRVVADADGAGAGTALEAAWLLVEQVNPSTGRVEARLTF